MSHQEFRRDNNTPQLQRRLTTRRKLQQSIRGRHIHSHQENSETRLTDSSGLSNSGQKVRNNARTDYNFGLPELPLGHVSIPPPSLARQIAERKSAATRVDHPAQPKVERSSKIKDGFKKVNRMIRALWSKEPATVAQITEERARWEGLQKAMSQRSAFNNFGLSVTSELRRIAEEDEEEDP